ncbi:hypothetical protein BD626DRAFT_419182 [Schizophyllum amplum]|uniref:CCHC-type domain-containing protein n=1 Tax=Schizophyllum amplum TaxID=97359 RepID=A0A550BRV0_9AGAR|nr:hypothetical protein BD626DRAFT_419182 [Auriculariopsis ampla]
MSIPSYAVNSLMDKEKLRGEENWYAFEENIVRFCRGINATWVTSDKTTKVADADVALDNAIGFVLATRLERDVEAVVKDKYGGWEMYATLKAKYTKSTMARRVAARKAFYQCSHDFPTQSLEQFITTVQDKARVLTDMGISVADTEILDVILMNIHPAFFTVRTTLLSQSTEPTLTSAIGTLTSSPALNYDFVKTEEEDTSRLLAANAARSGRPQRKDAEPRSGGRTLDLSASWMDDKGYRWCDVNSSDCHRCGHPGHIAAFCMFSMPEAIKQRIMDKVHLNANMAQSVAEMDAEVEQAYQVHQAYGTYVIPHRQSSPPRHRSPSPYCAPSPVSSSASSRGAGHAHGVSPLFS